MVRDKSDSPSEFGGRKRVQSRWISFLRQWSWRIVALQMSQYGVEWNGQDFWGNLTVVLQEDLVFDDYHGLHRLARLSLALCLSHHLTD